MQVEGHLHYQARMQYLYAIMLIGYARVSTGEQTTAAQVAALKTSGCELIFRDNASGGRWDRPELHKLLSQLRKGDVLVVWTLDRLSRSLRDVLTIMERVQERHAGFRSLKEAVDTTTPAGRMMMQMVGAFAEFERAMLKERTKAGLDAARKEGRIGGRPPKLKPHQQQEIVTLVKQGKKTAADAARLFGVHPATVSRLLRRTWIESSTVLSVPLLPKPRGPLRGLVGDRSDPPARRHGGPARKPVDSEAGVRIRHERVVLADAPEELQWRLSGIRAAADRRPERPHGQGMPTRAALNYDVWLR